MDHYILVNNQPVRATLEEWAAWFESSDRVLRQIKISDILVSTVFLGMDHQYSPGGRPLIFETMVFGGALDQYQERHSTWEEAIAGHERAVEAVQRHLLAFKPVDLVKTYEEGKINPKPQSNDN